MSQALLLTVNGTAVPDPFGPGFSSDIGRALTNPWWNIASQFWGQAAIEPYGIYWQPIGYPAATFPMTPSVNVAVKELDNQVTIHMNPDPKINLGGYCPPGWPKFLSGYSQGAIATATFLRDYVLAENAKYGAIKDDFVVHGGTIQFGDPVRCPGIAHGNEVAGFPQPKLLDGVITGGIAGPGCLTPAQTPASYLSCALDGDLYAAAPVGPTSGIATPSGAPWHNEPLVGQIETRIYNFVETGSLGVGILAIAKGIAQEFEYPLTNTLALCYAIFNGLKFAAAGPAAPHWQYGPFVPFMVQWIINRVRAFKAGLVAA